MGGRVDSAVPTSDGAVLLGVSLGFFVVLFDATAVNVATGTITDAFDTSVTAVQWVLNAYTVTFAALMLSAGGLGDRCGNRRGYLIGTAVFAAASAACALAPNVAMLIAARAVQGAGAAAVVPCSLAVIAAHFPAGPARARALGIWGGVSGVGLAAGPVLGGLLVTALGWRAVFLVVVPLAAVSITIVAARVSETVSAVPARFDPRGQTLVVVGLVALTAALTQISSLGWTDPRTIGLFAIAVLAGVALVLTERRLTEPMLPPAMMRSKRLGGALGIGLLFNFGLYGALFCLALVLERTLRESSVTTGLALLPLTVVVALGALFSGRLTHRFGPRTPLILGLGGGLVGAALLSGFGDDTGVTGLAACAAVLGLVGFAMPAMTAVALGATGERRAGLGAGLLNATRQAGGAFGIALTGSLALGHGTAPHLRAPMLLAGAGYLIALTLTVTTIREAGDRPYEQPHRTHTP